MLDVNAYLLKNAQSAAKKENPPFQNEFILKGCQNTQSVMGSLQQQIMDTNFNEPRSLIGGSAGKNDMIVFNSSSKKRKIMGLPES